ncbi:RidA family protein, partial [Rhizobium ruizarguesonis]
MTGVCVKFPTAAGKVENSPYERLAALGIALP